MQKHRRIQIKLCLLLLCGLVGALFMFASPARAQSLTFEDVKKLPTDPADKRIAYGSDPSQFGDLRLPKDGGARPVVIVLHGGCWYSNYDLNYMSSLASALTRLGAATWNLEYRRIGNAGGGWPGTFEDVARGTDYLRVLARSYPLDLNRVIVVGHSAGGELAIWLAARSHLPRGSSLYAADPLRVRGVISLAGITDMRKYRPDCGDAVTKLLGGSPEEFPDRYRQTSPAELLPLKVAQRLIHGDEDQLVPFDLSRDYAATARAKGDDVTLTTINGAGHFGMVSPQSAAWHAVEDSVRSLLRLNTRVRKTRHSRKREVTRESNLVERPVGSTSTPAR